MDKYKIKYIFSEEDINNIFVKVLTNELKKYIKIVSKDRNYFSLGVDNN